MKIYTEIIGNILTDEEWNVRAKSCDMETVTLDQWTAQKSRFLAVSDKGNKYPIALARHSHISNGDVIQYLPEENNIVVINIDLNPVMEIELSTLCTSDPATLIHTAVEIGHAIGNQHWPAVVKGNKIYVPLTVDKKVMTSVMDTHRFENITYKFIPGVEAIPYLAPHEIRRLFGGSSHEIHHHAH